MHKTDYAHLSDEKNVLEGLRNKGVKPGMYMFPGAECMKDMGNPEYIAKCELGPVGYMIVLPSKMWDMNKSLLQWFLYSVLMSVLTAYVANFSLLPVADFGDVMRLTGTVATIGYAMAAVPDSIWKGIHWGVTFRFVVDGLLYGLTTGAIFAWMW